ncbi:MAG: superoxide dismutase [Firmicutes bacterium]|nr:superoxide dismutase [Bacillota bacterium]
MNNHYPFILEPLPYAYNALEPFIDEKTMHLHHDKHLQTYINNLNAVLKNYSYLQDWSLEQLLYYIDYLPIEIKETVNNNAGGVYNHNLYFACISNDINLKNPNIASNLMQQINAQYGNFDNFKNEFKKQALSVFGSGYTCLASDIKRQLYILNTKNQDTILPLNLKPIFLIDVWEHAYYLKHYNVRADYIDNWFNILNFSRAEQVFNSIKK